jgi:hypothetical protein
MPVKNSIRVAGNLMEALSKTSGATRLQERRMQRKRQKKTGLTSGYAT